MPKTITRLPIVEEPLPGAGDSLREEVETLLFDKVLFWVFMTVVLGLLAFHEWAGWMFSWERQPLAITIFTIVFAVIAGFRVMKHRERIQRILKGIRGEKHASQYMRNELAPLGYRVFDDIPGDGFNVDHALVGPAGVFAIETKAYSLPADGDGVIEYDPEELWINGVSPERNPISQASANAAWLAQIFRKYDKNLEFRPVVLVPGWRVKRKDGGGSTWVVNFSGLLSFLSHEDDVLNPEQVDDLAGVLKGHLQNQAAPT